MRSAGSDTSPADRSGSREIRLAIGASAAGHAMILAAGLLLGPLASPLPRPGAVDVFLVSASRPRSAGGSGEDRSAAPGGPRVQVGPRPLPGEPPGAEPASRIEPGIPDPQPAGDPRPAAGIPSGPANDAPPALPVAGPAVAFADASPSAIAALHAAGRGGGTEAGSSGDGIGSRERQGASERPAFPGAFAERRPASIGEVRGSGGRTLPERPSPALLREKIQSRIVYPEEAVRRGQEGEVLLRIRIDPGGHPAEIRVARSSGTRLLDEAARRGVLGSDPLPAVPGWVEVPVRFFLR